MIITDVTIFKCFIFTPVITFIIKKISATCQEDFILRKDGYPYRYYHREGETITTETSYIEIYVVVHFSALYILFYPLVSIIYHY
ncbi:MAG: hypothetical protein DRQ03_04760 [Candidatus Hydrothermota bacterium]|nr:MAG: hypothetical protein DRQ03_04760 [Candidatus Hydrothermae bacterium]